MKDEKRRTIVFDADDTLWDCQGHFEVVMQRLYDELLPWTGTRDEAARRLFATERKNMHLLGFGVKAFTLSMLETAMQVSNGEIAAAKLMDILRQCYTLLEFPCTPLPEVRETLWQLQQMGVPMVVFTKGELLDQEHKLERSGLAGFFSYVEITSDKREADYRNLARKLGVESRQLIMVGNSLKSDIVPAIAAGWHAVYIPFSVTWQLEHHDSFEHERMRQIEHFGQLTDIVKEYVQGI